MQPELATQDMKDAQLGKSKGMLSKLDPELMNTELDDLLHKKVGDHPTYKPVVDLKPMSSLAPALLKNSLNNRIQRMIDNKINTQKQANLNRAKPQDFSKEYPLYYDMLKSYSGCRMFQDIPINLNTKVKTRGMRQISMSYCSTPAQNNFEHQQSVRNGSENYKQFRKTDRFLISKSITGRNTHNSTLLTAPTSSMGKTTETDVLDKTKFECLLE